MFTYRTDDEKLFLFSDSMLYLPFWALSKVVLTRTFLSPHLCLQKNFSGGDSTTTSDVLSLHDSEHPAVMPKTQNKTLSFTNRGSASLTQKENEMAEIWILKSILIFPKRFKHGVKTRFKVTLTMNICINPSTPQPHLTAFEFGEMNKCSFLGWLTATQTTV